MTPLSTDAQKVDTQPPKRPLRVVVVDDNRDWVLTTMALLRAEGHEVKGCYDGAKAYDCVEEFEADAVVLDIGLPGMTGWDVARQIRSRIAKSKHPIIVGITGEFDKGADRVLAQIAGFDYYLIKPADPKVLLALVEKARHRE